MPGVYNGFTGSQRMKAYRWLMAEYEAGRRVKPVRCDVCLHTAGVIEPHSEDYSPPYGDNIGRYGLCYRCHMMLHCRFRQPDAFAFYCRTLAEGDRFPAMKSRHFPTVIRDMSTLEKLPIEHTGQELPGFAALLIEGNQVKASRSKQGEMF